jgi:hypothetical protein
MKIFHRVDLPWTTSFIYTEGPPLGVLLLRKENQKLLLQKEEEHLADNLYKNHNELTYGWLTQMKYNKDYIFMQISIVENKLSPYCSCWFEKDLNRMFICVVLLPVSLFWVR